MLDRVAGCGAEAGARTKVDTFSDCTGRWRLGGKKEGRDGERESGDGDDSEGDSSDGTGAAEASGAAEVRTGDVDWSVAPPWRVR
jgi:hypothetical protein